MGAADARSYNTFNLKVHVYTAQYAELKAGLLSLCTPSREWRLSREQQERQDPHRPDVALFCFVTGIALHCIQTSGAAGRAEEDKLMSAERGQRRRSGSD